MTDAVALPPALTEVRTRHLVTVRLSVDPIFNLGMTPSGDRRVAVVTGGSVAGARLSGHVLPGGSDWIVNRPDGTSVLNVRLVIETDDKALIGMTYVGVRHGPPEVMAALGRGEAVDPSAYYFRTTPSFETASERYAWLNKLVAVGLGHRFPDGPLYNIFEVL
jgi:hypothetical protein